MGARQFGTGRNFNPVPKELREKSVSLKVNPSTAERLRRWGVNVSVYGSFDDLLSALMDTVEKEER
jgi:hypothetical protein